MDNQPVTSESASNTARGSKVNSAEMTHAQKYRRVRKINNESSRKCRLKEKGKVPSLIDDEALLEEKNCILHLKQNSLIQQKEENQRRVEEIIKTCSICKNTPYVQEFIAKKSSDDLERLSLYIKMTGSHNNINE